MFKLHSNSALIKTRHYVALFALLTLFVGSQNASAQSQLAQDTYAIFEASCLNCHGADGAFRETLLMEHSELINGGTVLPGNPNASELYKRLLGPTENGAQMPFGLPQLPPQSIDIVRRWILGGAPDWTVTTTPLRRFITPREALTSIESHLNSLSSFDRSFARYFTITHLYNAGETVEVLVEYRKALNKLVNSLSWGSGIANPQPIDPQATIFYIDLRHYEWDRNDGWTKIEEEYPYHIAFDAQTALRNQLGRLQTQMKTDVTSVHIDWFIANASTPPLYHELLSLPTTVRELELQLDVDVVGNLTNAPGVRVWRAGFNNSGVSNHNRLVERHTSQHGAYWKSYDFAGSVGTRNVFTHPLSFTHDGGEVIFNLPNGLQGYYLVDAFGSRLDEAPIGIVSNPAASDPTVRNGISCIGCHTEGMKTFEDEVRSVIESNPNPPYNKAQALRLYVEKSEMDALLVKDMEKYRAALAATGGVFGGVEPVSRFHEAFQGPIDAAYAAAVVGLQTATFLQKVRENTGLQNVGLLALDTENGSVKRDAWTSNFRDVMYALDYPPQVGEPPVVTPPDVIPGRLIEIPDPNLRALLEETLGTRTIRPDVMATLTTLNVNRKDIADLTGLEFAINLEELQIEHNPVSDLSPLTGCVNLIRLLAWNTPNISDLSPLANLTKLEEFDHKGSKISDISPLVGLTNLRVLRFYGADISDISPISGMTTLQRVRFRHTNIADITPLAELFNLIWLDLAGNDIRDLSPLAELFNLEWLDLAGNEITDLSLLRKLSSLEVVKLSHNKVSNLEPIGLLTELRVLDFSENRVTDIRPLRMLTNLIVLSSAGNRISDVSPLAGLTELEELRLEHNEISDLSSLAGLTNLRRLELQYNRISDFSPLQQLGQNIPFIGRGNPGYPIGGAIIEGPWLWLHLPGISLRENFGTDLLSEASGSTVTEIGIATRGATAGSSVGDEEWTSHKLPTTGRDNIKAMLGSAQLHGVVYGNVSLYAPVKQDTTFHIGAFQPVKVWFNGPLLYQRDSVFEEGEVNYNEFFPVTLERGRNVLLIATHLTDRDNESYGYFGFASDTEYMVINPGITFTFSETPIHVDDTFTLDIRAENVFDLAGWQFDIVFDPARLEALEVREGDFLKSDGGTTFFQIGRIDNGTGKITGLIAGRISEGGVSGSGSVLQVRFKAKSGGDTEIALQNFLFGSAAKESIPAAPLEIHFTVEERLLTGDVNRDGVVNILDLISVAQQLGQRVPANSPEDINDDGVVNIFDLTLVAQGIGGAAAPPARGIDSSTIKSWIAEARLADDGSIAFLQGIANLENLLTSLIIPQETSLHANYPNPFNPETWIPYQLAAHSEVALTIYDMHGGVVRRLEVGHQAAGMYRNRNRAAYWDGRNQSGEFVASGLYFYTLKAGKFAATRKMLIRK